MKILMVTPRFPYPPQRGDAVRAWEQLTFLAREHEVYLAACVTQTISHAQLEQARRHCAAVAIGLRGDVWALAQGMIDLLGGGALSVGYFARPGLQRQINAWHAAHPFDAVLVFGGACAPLVEQVDAARRVLDLNDVDSLKYRAYAHRNPLLRPLYALEADRLAACERRWFAEFDLTLLVNDRERDKLLATFGPQSAAVLRTTVPIPVDDTLRWHPHTGGAQRIGIVGSMFYPPNVRAVDWFARNVWPRIRAMHPSAKLRIIGNRPVRAVRRWGRSPGITVTGRVPSIEAELAQLQVFANPVFGDLGVQTKTLCAMAVGTPSVVTNDTAAGLDFDRAAPPFVITDQPADFAAACVALLSDKQRAARLSELGRRVALRYYNAAEELPRLAQWLTPGATRASVGHGAQAIPGGVVGDY